MTSKARHCVRRLVRRERLTSAQKRFVDLLRECGGSVPAHNDLCPCSERTALSLIRRGIIWEDSIGRMTRPVYRLSPNILIGSPRLGKSEAARLLTSQIDSIPLDETKARDTVDAFKHHHPKIVELWKQFEAKK
jgi:hypothetical protein